MEEQLANAFKNTNNPNVIGIMEVWRKEDIQWNTDT